MCLIKQVYTKLQNACRSLDEYLNAFLADSVSSFLGAGVVFGADLVIDGVKKSSSSDIESNIPPTFLAEEEQYTASQLHTLHNHKCNWA